MRRRLALLLGTLLLAPAPAQAATVPLDRAQLRPAAADPAVVPARVRAARASLARSLGARAVVATDRRTGGLRSVTRPGGFLTEPSERGPAAVALGYVRAHADAFGLDRGDVERLRLVSRERSPAGIEYLSWAQVVDGIPSLDTRLEASVAPGNRLLAVTGAPDGDLEAADTTPQITAAQAERAAHAGRPGERGATPPALVLHHPDGSARLAWRVAVRESSTAYWDVLVDAAGGEVVRRVNRVEFAQPTASVFDRAPAGQAQQPREIGQWLGESGRLKGPHVHAFADVGDVVRGPGGPLAPQNGDGDVGPNSGANWDDPLQTFSVSGDPCPPGGCTWNPNPGGSFSWQANLRQDVAQLFFYVNRFHDHLRFDPGIAFATGAFEGEDAVIAQALDGANTDRVNAGFPDCEHANNANFTTLRDGIPGFMQMYLFDPAQPQGCASPKAHAISGTNDPTIVFHEYAHGLTSRLVTDATGEPALDAPQSGAMGEAWSDFYAFDLLDPADPAGPGHVVVGDYATDGGVRTQALDCLVGDGAAPLCAGSAAAGNGGYTYGDFARVSPSGGPQVHSDGEIWGQTLWQLRRAVGAPTARLLVTEGLRGAPDNPSFLEVRNAMLNAAQVRDPALVPVLWQMFAERGMGFYAASPDGDDVRPAQDFSPPPGGEVPRSTVSGRVTDALTGRPVAGALVRVGAFEARTGDDGAYAIGGVPQGSYGAPVVAKGGYDEVVLAPLTVAGGAPATVDAALSRDWALASGGAAYTTNLVPDYGSFGCGPSALGDRDGGRAGWVTNPGTFATVTLPQAVEVTQVAIEPGARCGSIAEAGLKDFELLAGPSEGALTKVAEGSFAADQGGAPVAVALPGVLAKTRVLRLVAKSQLDPVKAGYVEVAELVVRGAPSPLFDAPGVALGDATPSPAGAVLRGTVDGRGAPATAYWFEFGRTTAYGSKTPEQTLPAGAASVPVTASVAGLATRAGHHVRLVARNETGTTTSADGVFTTTYGLTGTPRLRCPRRGAKPRCRLSLPGLQGLRAKIELRRNGRRIVLVKRAKVSRAGSVRIRVARARLRGRRARFSLKVTFKAPKAPRATVESRRLTVR